MAGHPRIYDVIYLNQCLSVCLSVTGYRGGWTNNFRGRSYTTQSQDDVTTNHRDEPN